MRHLSLCTGYGGIDLALRYVFGAETVAVADVDPGACKILAHRFPGVPNLGDITTVDWSQWAGKVDAISGGTPCQDLSHAGRRAGMTDGTRSNLWVAMREAIATIRPSLVVWENVRGAYSATADSAVEPCPGCVGDGTGVHLRALGRVLGDLSSLGYDANWYGLRASDVGAAHHRFRVFVFAWPADAASLGWERRGRARDWWDRPADSDSSAVMLPTPNASDGPKHAGQPPEKRRARGHSTRLADVVECALPTPAVNDMGEGKTVDDWDVWTAKMQAAHGNGNGHGKSLAIEAQRLLLKTSTATEKPNGRAWRFEKYGEGRRFDLSDQAASLTNRDAWGDYAPAITRWEHVIDRPAPDPTEPGKNGPRLSPRFVEWLMGLPAGWITDVPNITRTEALKACGNGVVPQQCAEAARRFVRDTQKETAA